MTLCRGQIGPAKVAMDKLLSPKLNYVISENNFTLDINNTEEPKIVCLVIIRRSSKSIVVYLHVCQQTC